MPPIVTADPFLARCDITAVPATVEQFNMLFDVHFHGGVEACSSLQRCARSDIVFSATHSCILDVAQCDDAKMRALFPAASSDVRARMVRDATPRSVIFVCVLDRDLSLPANRAAAEPADTTSHLVVVANLSRRDVYGCAFLVPRFPFNASAECRGIAGLLTDERLRRADCGDAAPTTVMCAVTDYVAGDDEHAQIALFVEAHYGAEPKPTPLIRRIVVRTELDALFEKAFTV